jgi:hypothetical protein
MDRDAILLHQVHRAKLAADVGAGVVSDWLMWRRRVPLALLAAFLPAILASAITMRSDLSKLRRTRRGRYVLAHMPPAAQTLRGIGQFMMWWAAYRHSRIGMALGLLVVAIGWSHGILGRLPGWRRG